MVGLAALAGIALRVWTYRSLMGTPNADEAVVGLMARHAVHGELTAFYWGQAYGGTQEVMLTVPLFWVAGSSWLALRLVPIALTVVAVILIWRVGRRTIGEPAATVAAALLWVWPPFGVFLLTHQQGFYASEFVYCALILLLALRVAERPDRRRVGELGLVLGLAFWQTAQIVPIAVGVVAWTIWRQPRSLRHVAVAVTLGALGALPWIGWNSTHGWGSLSGIDPGAFTRSLRLLASPALPMLAGLRVPLSAQLLLPALLTYAVYVCLFAAFLIAAFRARRRDVSLLYVVVAVFPFVYALSPKTALALSTPRFIIVLAPVLALLFGQFARTVTRGAVVLTLALLVSVVTLHRMDDWFGGTPRPTTQERGLGPRDTVQLVPRNVDVLVATLDRLDLDHVYADYWLAYRLDFDTHERITAVENRLVAVTFEGRQAVPSAPLEVRYLPYARAVLRARHGFVFYRKIVATASVVTSLERHGYHRHLAGPFVVYAPP
jgi:Dolichyl-phosphate-mannose-protein mannosyltransferase